MTGPALPDQLDGLVGELSKLKTALGYDEEQEQFAAIEKRMIELLEENEEYRKYAEQAILEAQSMKLEYDDLQQSHEEALAELNSLKMADMVAKTDELTQAAYEYDRDVVESCVAEVEDFRQEVDELRERVQELEQENAGLTETLSEMRQSQHQLQALQQSVEAGLLATPGAKSVAGSLAESTPYKTPEGTTQQSTPEGGVPSADPSPDKARFMPVQLAFNIVPPPEEGSRSGKDSQSASKTPPKSVSSEDPEAIADALAAVAGGAEGGVVAVAAKMLREYGSVRNSLAEESSEKLRLQQEVDDLHNTMTSKTFKAPSAWAEREVKYKQDKRRWEESQKEANAKVKALQEQLSQVRSGTGASVLEERIQDLEAQMLQSQQERDSARAALHELQLSLRKEGEFGNAGVRTSAYAGASMQETVHKLESNSQGSDNSQDDANDLKAMGTAHSTPISKRKSVGFSPETTPSPLKLAKRTEEIEHRLAEVESARAAIEAELAAISASRDGTAQANGNHDWETKEIETEVALLKKGVDPETAHKLAVLDTELHELNAKEAELQSSSKLDRTVSLSVNLRIDEGSSRIKLNFDENGDLIDDGADDESEQPSAQPAAEAASPTGASPADEELAQRIAAVAEQKAGVVAEMQQILATEKTSGVQISSEGIAVKDSSAVEGVGGDASTPETLGKIQELESALQAKKRKMHFAEDDRTGDPSAEAASTDASKAADQLVRLNINASEPPIRLNIAVPSGPDERDQRIKELEASLLQKRQEEDDLRKELLDLPPVRLSLNVVDGPGLSTRASSGTSLVGMSLESLAKDRAEADLEWAEYKKNTDGPALIRAKAELETKCALLETQLANAKAALDVAELDKQEMERHIDAAMSSGDVKALNTWREKLRSSSKSFADMASPKRHLKLFKKKGAPSKQAMATALHGTQDALHETEAERNALRRQLARMSEKMKQVEAQSPGKSPGKSPGLSGEPSADDELFAAIEGNEGFGAVEDLEIELHALRDENMTLMDQLVETKIKFAETHGDYLESRRSLLRSRERQLHLTNQLQQAQTALANATAHLRPLQSSSPSLLDKYQKSPKPSSEPIAE